MVASRCNATGSALAIRCADALKDRAAKSGAGLGVESGDGAAIASEGSDCAAPDCELAFGATSVELASAAASGGSVAARCATAGCAAAAGATDNVEGEMDREATSTPSRISVIEARVRRTGGLLGIEGVGGETGGDTA